MENKDAILAMNTLAQERKKAGFPVINGTIGMMYDDEGRLPLSPTLRGVLSRHTDDEDLTYSSVAGEPSYNLGLQKWFFGSDFDAEIQGGQFLTLGTIGGTGACSIAFHSSSANNGLLLLPDLDWPNYEAVAHLYGIRTESYPLFKEDRLNVAGIQKIIDEKKPFFERIALLINDPCENPTGYCMDDKDWKALIQLVNHERKSISIALIVDCAYLDFADDVSRHRIASSLKRLDDGVKVYLAMSFSKTFSFYGLRIGALAIYDSDAKEAKSEYDLAIRKARAIWSVPNHMASNVIADLLNHEETFRELKKEVGGNKELVAKRALIFTREAASVGLKTYPYSFGFFISIPCLNARKVSEELQKSDIYIVPVRDDVLRLALSCVPTSQIAGLASAIKKAADSVNPPLDH